MTKKQVEDEEEEVEEDDGSSTGWWKIICKRKHDKAPHSFQYIITNILKIFYTLPMLNVETIQIKL